jgi:hypothetical protein
MKLAKGFSSFPNRLNQADSFYWHPSVEAFFIALCYLLKE